MSRRTTRSTARAQQNARVEDEVYTSSTAGGSEPDWLHSLRRVRCTAPTRTVCACRRHIMCIWHAPATLLRSPALRSLLEFSVLRLPAVNSGHHVWNRHRHAQYGQRTPPLGAKLWAATARACDSVVYRTTLPVQATEDAQHQQHTAIPVNREPVRERGPFAPVQEFLESIWVRFCFLF